MLWRDALGIIAAVLLSGLSVQAALAQGTAQNFVGVAAEWYPANGYALVETGQKPYDDTTDYVVDASTTTVSVDDAAGTISGSTTLTVTGSFLSTESSDVTCQQTITEATTFSGTFTPGAYAAQNGTFEKFANGTSTFTRTVTTGDLTVPPDYDTFFGTPDQSWCQTGWTSEGVWYALHNDQYDIVAAPSYANNTNDYVTIYTDVPYQFLGRAWLDKPVPDLSINHIEVVQVVQDATNSIPLIAQKSTMVRVFLNISAGPLEPIPNVSVKLHGTRYGLTLPGSPLSPLNPTITALNVPQRADLTQSLNFKLPDDWVTDGTVVLSAEVVAPTTVTENSANNILDNTVTFVPRQELDVAYIPICYQPPGQAKDCPSNAITTAAQLMKKLFPVADSGVDYYPLPVSNWVWDEPLYGTEDIYYIMAALRMRYDLTDNVEGIVPDQLAGWIPASAGGGLLGLSDPLWAEKGGAGRVSINKDSSTLNLPSCTTGGSLVDPLDPQVTLAHEIAHNLGLRHTNKPDSCRAEDPGTPWPYADSLIQELGVDVAVQQIVPVTKFDIMTYNSPPVSNMWISPYSYVQLFNSQLDPQKSVAGTTKTTAARYLLLAGVADRAGTTAQITSSYVVTAHTDTAASDPVGNYCAQAITATGLLEQYCFTLEFMDHYNAVALEQQPFSIKMPLADGVTTVALASAAGIVFDSVATTASAPAVALTNITVNQNVTDGQTITWQGSDADSDLLQYVVRYSPDGGNSWYPLATDLTTPEFTIDTAGLTATDNAYFEVMASDGLQTTSQQVGPVSIVTAAESADDTTDDDYYGYDYDETANPGSNNAWLWSIGAAVIVFVGGGAVLLMLAIIVVAVKAKKKR